MRYSISVLIALAGCVVSAPAVAEDSLTTNVFSQASADYSECFAYHMIGKQCAPENATEAQLAPVQSWAEKALDGMMGAGKGAGMSDAALTAEEKLAFDTVAKLTENKPCINYSVLLVKYGDFCRELEQSPGKRVLEICNQLAQAPEQRAMCERIAQSVQQGPQAAP